MASEIQIRTALTLPGSSDHTGLPITIKPFPNSGHGLDELPSAGFFIYIRVTDADPDDIETMIRTQFEGDSLIQPWERRVDFQVVNNNPVIDGWRMKAFTINPGFNNYAGITRNMVETYLNKWNASVFSVATNEVIFDSLIYNAITSNGFWAKSVANIFFSEISYEQSTGIHIVTADYSLVNIEDRQVKSFIEAREGIVNSQILKIVNFSISRTSVFKYFKADVQRRLNQVMFKRQFYITPALVSTIQAEGGIREVTLSQVQTYLKNKLDDVI